MKSSRRTFIKTGAMAVAAAAILRQKAFASSKVDGGTVGLQLYSVRDEMQKDPLGTLKQLAAMGYVYLEHANYVDRKFYGYAAPEFKKVLDDLGMKMVSGHTVFGLQHWDGKGFHRCLEVYDRGCRSAQAAICDQSLDG